ncbi:hypothetical protein TWF730_010379 [Orbilia blumenaviensis]|uniref:Uncharacterized protein n=1 Tax=Orbilia blumenaviensis TaxID=1796055 RepID=A0AAV9UN28_9PEZI
MSTEAPKDTSAEAQAKKDEELDDLQQQELATWIPYITAQGVESKQILYTLSQKRPGVNAPALIENPYFIAIRGSDLGYFMDRTVHKDILDVPFVPTDIYFVSMSELAACCGSAKKNKNVSTRDQVTGVFEKATKIGLFTMEGKYLNPTVGFPAKSFSKFADMAAKSWTICGTEKELQDYLATRKTDIDNGIDPRAIFCGPSAGFQPLALNMKTETEGQKALAAQSLKQLTAYLAECHEEGAYKDGFLYKSQGEGVDPDITPALKFKWFERVSMRPRYDEASAALLAPEDGLYVRLNMEDFKRSTLDVGHGKISPNRCYIEKKHFKKVWAGTSFGGGDGEIVGVQKGQKRTRGGDDEDTSKSKASKPGNSTDISDGTTDPEKEKGKSKAEEVIKTNPRRDWEAELGAEDKAVSTVSSIIYFRDEVGKIWSKTPSDSQMISNFMSYYAQGTTRPDYASGRFARAIDMPILEVYINRLINDHERYGGTAAQPREKLYDMFERIRISSGAKTKYHYIDPPKKTADIDPAEFTLLSRSCFGDYDTYIKNTLLAEYLKVDITEPRQVPKDIDVDIIDKLAVTHGPGIEKLASFNQVPKKNPPEYVDHTSRETRITALKIDRAFGTRGNALTQGAVMEGISATDVAKALGWSDMRTTSQRGWEKERFARAEWLHRCGYAYGGLTDDDANSSQVKENLIFGSSETNSIMTRYEDVYRNAIIRERNLYEQLKPVFKDAPPTHALGDLVHGRLITVLSDGGGTLSSKNNAFERVPIPVPKSKINPVPKTWTDISKRYPWLCSELTYTFSLDGTSRIFKNGTQWTNRFFPFDRLFFTRLEGVIDEAISLKLWELAMFDAKATVAIQKGQLAPNQPKVVLRTSTKGSDDVVMDEN